MSVVRLYNLLPLVCIRLTFFINYIENPEESRTLKIGKINENLSHSPKDSILFPSMQQIAAIHTKKKTFFYGQKNLKTHVLLQPYFNWKLSGMSWRQFLFKYRVVCGKIEIWIVRTTIHSPNKNIISKSGNGDITCSYKSQSTLNQKQYFAKNIWGV